MSVFRLAMAAERRAVLAWAAAMGVLGFWAMALFPAIRASAAYAQLWQDLPPDARAFFLGVDDATTLTGYLDGQFLSFVPILLGVHVAFQGARALAGAEERGELDLWLVLPMSRRRYLIEQAGAIAVGATLITLVIACALWLGAWAADVRVDAGRLLLSAFRTLPVTLLFAAIALLASSALRRARHALVTTLAVIAALYLLDVFAAFIDALHGLQSVSVLRPAGGEAVGDVVLLYAAGHVLLALVLVGVAVLVYARKDLGAKASP